MSKRIVNLEQLQEAGRDLKRKRVQGASAPSAAQRKKTDDEDKNKNAAEEEDFLLTSVVEYVESELSWVRIRNYSITTTR